MTATNATTVTSTPVTQFPLGALYQMTEDDLKALQRSIKDRLRTMHALSTDNLNVVSVRLPIDTCDRVRNLAVARRSTLSDVIREAVLSYCRKETR